MLKISPLDFELEILPVAGQDSEKDESAQFGFQGGMVQISMYRPHNCTYTTGCDAAEIEYWLCRSQRYN